eukprot:2235909-Rhodomonas_salina.1
MTSERDLWMADLTALTWTNVPQSEHWPAARCFHSAVAVEGKMLIFGGILAFGTESAQLSNELWIVEPGAWIWKQVEGSTHSFASAGHSAVVSGSFMWVFGGLSEQYPCGQVSCWNPTNNLAKLDTRTWEWLEVQASNSPAPRAAHFGVLANTEMVVFGGTVSSGSYERSIEFDDIYMLPVSTIVLQNKVAGGISLSMVYAYSSLLLPARLSLPPFSVQSSFVTIEPSGNFSVAILPTSGQRHGIIQCKADLGCTRLTLRSLVLDGAGVSKVRVLNVEGPHAVMLVEDSVLKSTSCASEGCAAFASSTSRMEFHSSIVYDMKSDLGGGALSTVNSEIRVTASSFFKNTADKQGGAILCQTASVDTGVSRLDLVDSIFVANEAREGGGAVSCNGDFDCSVRTSQFVSNRATGLHGGSLLSNHSGLQLEDTVFSNNSALQGGGGAVFWTDSAPQVGSCVGTACVCGTEGRTNQALFGGCVASEPHHLLHVNETHLNVVDYYNQTIQQHVRGQNTLDIFAFDRGLPTLQGSTVGQREDGGFSFFMPKMIQTPTYSPGVWQTTSGIMSSIAVLESESWNERFDHSFGVLECPEEGVIKRSPLWPISVVDGRSAGLCDACGAGFYARHAEPDSAEVLPSECVPCPKGIDCDFSVTKELVGSWVTQDGFLVLLSCPPGYQLINSTDGTSVGTFSHDNQECKKCLTDTQYIIHPDSGACTECPTGLRCFGNEQVEPVVVNSTWVEQDGRYVLQACPKGYHKRVESATVQECEPCGPGTECPQGNCDDSCTACKPGSFKGSSGVQDCSLCPANTYGPDTGAVSISHCIACPRFATTDGKGHASSSACTCDARYFTNTLNINDPCTECPAGARCEDGNCALGSTDPS